MSADDPATINAVAALIAYQFGHEMGTPPKIQFLWAAQALAEAGRLKAPADEILTEADRAVLDAAERWRDVYNDASVQALVAAIEARRVAAGGTEATPQPLGPESINWSGHWKPEPNKPVPPVRSRPASRRVIRSRPAGGTAPTDAEAELRCSHGCAVSNCPDPASHHAYPAPTDEFYDNEDYFPVSMYCRRCGKPGGACYCVPTDPKEAKP